MSYSFNLVVIIYIEFWKLFIDFSGCSFNTFTTYFSRYNLTTCLAGPFSLLFTNYSSTIYTYFILLDIYNYLLACGSFRDTSI